MCGLRQADGVVLRKTCPKRLRRSFMRLDIRRAALIDPGRDLLAAICPLPTHPADRLKLFDCHSYKRLHAISCPITNVERPTGNQGTFVPRYEILLEGKDLEPRRLPLIAGRPLDGAVLGRSNRSRTNVEKADGACASASAFYCTP